jgi:hypothetical protein
LCSDSLHPDSKLTEYITLLTGKPPNPNDDSDALLGLGCRLQTKQTTGPKGTYANIVNRSVLAKDDKPPAIPLNYQRRVNRPPSNPKGNGSGLSPRPQ